MLDSGDFDLRLYGELLIFTIALGECGDASEIDSSWPWSEHCFWVGLLFCPGFGVDPAAEVLEARTGSGGIDDKTLDVVFLGVGAVGPAAGRAHVEEPLRLTEPDFIRKKAPLSWEVVLMERKGRKCLVST